jgi:hypothetical protein
MGAHHTCRRRGQAKTGALVVFLVGVTTYIVVAVRYRHRSDTGD